MPASIQSQLLRVASGRHTGQLRRQPCPNVRSQMTEEARQSAHKAPWDQGLEPAGFWFSQRLGSPTSLVPLQTPCSLSFPGTCTERLSWSISCSCAPAPDYKGHLLHLLGGRGWWRPRPQHSVLGRCSPRTWKLFPLTHLTNVY